MNVLVVVVLRLGQPVHGAATILSRRARCGRRVTVRVPEDHPAAGGITLLPRLPSLPRRFRMLRRADDAVQGQQDRDQVNSRQHLSPRS